MADLGAVADIGESIAAMLRARRTLLAAEGRLGPVPTAQDIAHVPVAKLVSNAPPTAGLSLTCYHVGRSDHAIGRNAAADPSQAIGISLELAYLLVSWGSTASDELSLLSWAMLELSRYPTLDQGMLTGTTKWERGETIQLAPEESDPDAVFRIWDALQAKYRLSTLFRARVVRIGYGPAMDGLPVAASRFSFEHGDPAMATVPA